jgi:AraC-like DNA-binding protein
VNFTFISRDVVGPHVESVWFARGRIGHRRELIAPTGSSVAGVVLGDPIRQNDHLAVTGFLIGPHDRPIVNEPTGETYCLGIVTTPVGCLATFGVPPATIRGRVLDWPRAAELREAALGDPGDLLDLITPAATDLDDRTARVAAAVDALTAEPARPIADIAARLGVSHGHLDREFVRVVGLGPRVLARILRVRRLLENIDIRTHIPWQEHAAALGWYDQAHLIRDFKRHTGVTPSEYQAAQRTVTDNAPGFVPET